MTHGPEETLTAKAAVYELRPRAQRIKQRSARKLEGEYGYAEYDYFGFDRIVIFHISGFRPARAKDVHRAPAG